MSLLNRTRIPGPYAVSERARGLHGRLFVADMHCDALLWGRNLLERDTRGHVDVPRLIEGNVALQAFTAVTWISATMNIHRTGNRLDVLPALMHSQGAPAKTWRSPRERALHQAASLAKAAKDSEGRFTLIQTREDLEQYGARRENPRSITAGFLGIEGLHALEGDIETLQTMVDAGFRMMGPVHFFDNRLGGSAHGKRKGGLTTFGRDVIRAMERLGVFVDLAHASPAMLDDVLDMATRPVVVSHTGMQGFHDSIRNLSDNHAKRIAETGGLIGMGFWKTATGGKDVTSIAQSIRYAADVVGADHVALGSDFDGAVTTPFDSSGMAVLTEALLDAGFPETEIDMVMGGNVLRFLLDMLPSGTPAS